MDQKSVPREKPSILVLLSMWGPFNASGEPCNASAEDEPFFICPVDQRAE